MVIRQNIWKRVFDILGLSVLDYFYVSIFIDQINEGIRVMVYLFDDLVDGSHVVEDDDSFVQKSIFWGNVKHILIISWK